MKTTTFLKTLQLLLLTIISDSLLGQANVNLSNLSTTAVNQHLLPGNNNNRNLGSVGKSWKDIYTDGNIYLDDIVFITNKNIVNNTFVGASAGNVTTGIANTGIGYQSMLFNTFGAYNTGVGQSALLSNTGGNFNSALGVNALYSNTSGSFNTASGYQALNYNTTGSSNTAIGLQALFSNTVAMNNIAVGHKTLFSNTTGEQNCALGAEAMYSNISGNYNTSVGFQSLFSNTTGYDNTAVGKGALFSNNIGVQNTAYGNQAMYSNTNGNFNSANGYNSLYHNTSGSLNTANGYSALYSNTTGSFNNALGFRALNSNTQGTDNNAFGKNALLNNTIGTDNAAIGTESMINNTSGSINYAIGNYSLYNNTTGISNVGIGYGALYFNISGSNNVGLGIYADVSASNLSNATAIGSYAIVDANDKVRIGNTSVSSIGGQVSWTNFSDARIKDNIQENVPGLEFINELRPVTYHFNITKQNKLSGLIDTMIWQSKYDIEKIQFSGFIAQEVESAASTINYDFSGVDKSGEIMGLRYAEFVVPLVKAVQELDQMNNELKSENEELKTRLDRLESLILNNSTGENGNNQNDFLSANTLPAKLEQNIPNPFNGITSIQYFVPENSMSAQIRINNNQGIELKVFNITTGEGIITIHASELPSGNYNYSLIIDGRIIDTKNLIITK